MKPLTLEWIAKAEEDFAAAIALARLRRHILPNAVCFHGQQCAEKYLKAQLQEAGLPVPKIHDLTFLLQQLLPIHPLLAALHPNLLRLTDYGVDFRYPGNQATLIDAKSALRDCRTVRREIRHALGLPP
jgi:HEPN domain-containing protein